MNEEIEKIKDCIDSVYGCDCAYYGVEGMAIAQALYNAGYRKQSEGEWLHTGIEFAPLYECSVCRAMSFKYSYCPHCGARIKGGE